MSNTTITAEAKATNKPPAPLRARDRYLIRGFFFLACLLIAGNDSIYRVFSGFLPGTSTYGFSTLTYALILLYGLDRRRARELNIHDREVDFIIGGIGLVMAITIDAQLLPRFSSWNSLLRLDILALLLFLFGASALLYGSRATLSFVRGWMVLLGYNSVVFAVVSIGFGGEWFGNAMASVVGGVIVAVVVEWSVSWKQGIIAGLGTGLIGTVLALIAEAIWQPTRLTVIPMLVSMLVVLVLVARRTPELGIIRRRKPTVHKPVKAGAIILIAAVIMAAVQPPESGWERENLNVGAPGPNTLGVAVPEGWAEIDSEKYEWAPVYFGSGATLTRQHLLADAYNPDWDAGGLRRQVVADKIVANDVFIQRMVNEELLYDTINGRRSEARTVDLGHGIDGEVFTMLDEDAFVTYTKLVFAVADEGDTTSHLTVISSDDHSGDAAFPQLAPSLGALLYRLFTIFFRGNAVSVDPESDFKDLGLVTAVGRGIVDARFAQEEP